MKKKGNLENGRVLATMREKIWGKWEKTKCRTNYPINVQLSPRGLMVCVEFGNSSARLRSLLRSREALEQTEPLPQSMGPVVPC